ncbi:oligopeptide/dipeptide ABC transporter ATP-binding protein [Streptomyces sp. SID13726]|uniref:oligopeptide/dipeptide ABC transporter ATP-binding protein n=1 Tax=Streptomyces sp. SID13726 TaxID=2706058 RepID=UPI0013B869A9|nr:oligopeptide/dipeptide ABC transporter ATP-binding protein [Streptomyces sp. SID13726]NEB03530.1 ABC transporter ATP-binding protein [Streptomyces sp. SID13726]
MTEHTRSAALLPGADAGTALLDVRDLSVSYRRPGRRSGAVHAVRGVDLTVRRGETVGLVGESGSGKSTIGSAILGLVPATGGGIEFDGADITHSTRADRRLLARRMQVVFQDPYGSMNPAHTVGDTLAEALRHNVGLPEVAIRERVLAALADVGLPTGAAHRYPAAFSGGQRQRIAIARALVMEPEFVVCDEAVSALDLSVQAQVLNLLARLKLSRGLSYLFVSHDLAVVRYLSDTIVVLYAGRVVERGPAARIAERPAHPYTRALLAAAPVPDPEIQRRRQAERRRTVAAVAPSGRTEQGCDFAPRCPFAQDLCRTSRPELTDHEAVAVACHRYDELKASAA